MSKYPSRQAIDNRPVGGLNDRPACGHDSILRRMSIDACFSLSDRSHALRYPYGYGKLEFATCGLSTPQVHENVA
jgi:hypothetical protein